MKTLRLGPITGLSARTPCYTRPSRQTKDFPWKHLVTFGVDWARDNGNGVSYFCLELDPVTRRKLCRSSLCNPVRCAPLN